MVLLDGCSSSHAAFLDMMRRISSTTLSGAAGSAELSELLTKTQ